MAPSFVAFTPVAMFSHRARLEGGKCGKTCVRCTLSWNSSFRYGNNVPRYRSSVVFAVYHSSRAFGIRACGLHLRLVKRLFFVSYRQPLNLKKEKSRIKKDIRPNLQNVRSLSRCFFVSPGSSSYRANLGWTHSTSSATSTFVTVLCCPSVS